MANICLEDCRILKHIIDILFDMYGLRVDADCLFKTHKAIIHSSLNDMYNEVKEIIFAEEDNDREIILNCTIRSVDSLTKKFENWKSWKDDKNVFEHEIKLCCRIRSNLIGWLGIVKMTKG